MDVTAGFSLAQAGFADHERLPFARELEAAAHAALLGGRAVLDRYGVDGIRVHDKGEDDPVTEADHASNHAILKVLRAEFPDDTFRSEESAPPELGSGNGRLWLVDPLDGTKEFIARNGEFSIMVGLAVAGRSVAGAVYRPDPGVLYLGFADEDLDCGAAWAIAWPLSRAASTAHGDGRAVDRGPDTGRGPAAASRTASPRVARVLDADREPDPILRFVRSRSHPDERIGLILRQLEPVEAVLSGSVGVKCSLIADGKADLYVHPVRYTNEWDTCAAEAVLRGAGGRVTDCSGDPLTYGKADPHQPRGIFAGVPAAWKRAAPAVERAWPEEAAAGRLMSRRSRRRRSMSISEAEKAQSSGGILAETKTPEAGPHKSTNITWHAAAVSREERERLRGQRGAILWFTGLSGSGKSTLAGEVDRRLFEAGRFSYILDGDNVRHGLNRDLGFSPEDRTENIRRIGEVAKLLADAGTLVLTAFISPYRRDRDAVRELLPRDGDFVEIFVSCPLDVCEDRDPKGLYRKARAGEISDFTGIDAPYEEPDAPELTIRTDLADAGECAEQVLAFLRDKGYIGASRSEP